MTTAKTTTTSLDMNAIDKLGKQVGAVLATLFRLQDLLWPIDQFRTAGKLSQEKHKPEWHACVDERS